MIVCLIASSQLYRRVVCSRIYTRLRILDTPAHHLFTFTHSHPSLFCRLSPLFAAHHLFPFTTSGVGAPSLPPARRAGPTTMTCRPSAGCMRLPSSSADQAIVMALIQRRATTMRKSSERQRRRVDALLGPYRQAHLFNFF